MNFSEILLRRVNEERKKLGLSQLEHSIYLSQEANEHCKNMAKQDKAYHDLIPNKCLQNVSQGRKNFVEKPEVAVNLWLSHEGHKAPIISPKMKKLGSAYAIHQNGNVFVCANFGE